MQELSLMELEQSSSVSESSPVSSSETDFGTVSNGDAASSGTTINYIVAAAEEDPAIYASDSAFYGFDLSLYLTFFIAAMCGGFVLTSLLRFVGFVIKKIFQTMKGV